MIEAVRRIVVDLNDSGIVEMFSEGVDTYQKSSSSEREKSTWIEFTILSNFISRTSSYSETENYILNIFNVFPLTQPSTWQPYFTISDIGFLYSNYNHLRTFREFLPKIVTLLEREYNGERREKEDAAEGVSIQTVILSEEGSGLSSPKRITELLHSISQIYDVIAEMEGVSGNSLAIVGMDSGSEKSFDFLGLAKIMQELRETLQWAYNIVVFHKQNVTVRNLQVAGETLSVVAKIAKLEADKAISSEDALRMRHGLFTGLEKFSETGAYIPEMNSERQSPALVMRPQPRLLTAPPEEIIREANQASTSSEAGAAVEIIEEQFTPEQIRAAVALLSLSERSPQPKNTAKDAKKRVARERK
jgi:hypothetical protein